MRVSIIPRIVKKLRQLIGIVQDTDTATRNIEEGKYVVWKGSLCKSTTAITTGDTLSSSNLEAVADGGLNELNSNQLISTGLTYTNATYKSGGYVKIGKLVVVELTINKTNTADGTSVSGLPLPVPCTPNNIGFGAYVLIDSYTDALGKGWFVTNPNSIEYGVLRIGANNTAGDYSICFTYVCV